MAFRLKVLMHEGLLREDGSCECETDLNSCEKSFLQQLALSRDFAWIAAQPLSLELANKGRRLFEFSLAD
jgi:hypothetical protein